jgi:hypothetical protein
MAKLTHANALKDLQSSQQSDHDGRQKARVADHFVNKKDGQWEPDIAAMFDDKPRYTIDLTSGIVADAAGEMATMDFDIKVRPAGGPSTTKIAQHYDGLIRNIENNSGAGAKYIYRAAGKQMLTTGIGGWGIKHDFRDPMSFDQDLIIKPISNFMDRVWFDPGFEMQDASDSDWGFKLTSMTMAKYEKDFPDGSKMSLGRDLCNNVYAYKNDNAVIVGEYYCKRTSKTDLVLMSDGSIYEVDEKFNSIKDELQAAGITVDRSREVDRVIVYHQMLDGKDFITDSKKTVFSDIPLVPVFGNFEISEDKVIYWGLVEKHMDPQRILNYVESRKVEEGALAPRAKKWMTPEQMAGNENSLRTMNTNSDPVQRYNHIDNQPSPFETGGAQINPGLSETAQSMQRHMQSIAGSPDPSRADSLGLQSGVALKALQNKGDTRNIGYFISMEIAIAHTCKILGNSIPKVYDSLREVQLDFQDKTSKTITINERIYDEDAGKVVEINDLSKGIYSFVCSSGPAFHNRQQETIAAINEVAALDPSIMQTGSDIYLNNIPAPGMDKIAKRRRAQMVTQGLIPEDELSDEEIAKLEQQAQAQANQQQQPDAIEQASLAIAQAEMEKAQAGTADILSKIDERDKKLMLAFQEMQIDQQNTRDGNMIKLMQAQDDQIKTFADTLKVIKDAIGADTIVGPSNTEAYKQQSTKLLSAIATSE